MSGAQTEPAFQVSLLFMCFTCLPLEFPHGLFHDQDVPLINPHPGSWTDCSSVCLVYLFPVPHHPLCTYVTYWQSSWRNVVIQGQKRNRCVGYIIQELESWRFPPASFTIQTIISYTLLWYFPFPIGALFKTEPKVPFLGTWSGRALKLPLIREQGRKTELWTARSSSLKMP